MEARTDVGIARDMRKGMSDDMERNGLHATGSRVVSLVCPELAGEPNVDVATGIEAGVRGPQ